MDSDSPRPVIVATADELLVFSSAAAATRWLEPIDVEGGEYLGAWDDAGRPLRLAVVPSVGRSWLSRLSSGPDEVVLQPAGGEPDDAGLRPRLELELQLLGAALPDRAPLVAHIEAVMARRGFIC